MSRWSRRSAERWDDGGSRGSWGQGQWDGGSWGQRGGGSWSPRDGGGAPPSSSRGDSGRGGGGGGAPRRAASLDELVYAAFPLNKQDFPEEGHNSFRELKQQAEDAGCDVALRSRRTATRARRAAAVLTIRG